MFLITKHFIKQGISELGPAVEISKNQETRSRSILIQEQSQVQGYGQGFCV